MMTVSALIRPALLALFCAGPLAAADFSDPTWPCVQRKVASLSAGIMWPHPLEDHVLGGDLRADAKTLVETLALRRVGLDEAETLVADFADRHPGLTTADLGAVFSMIFTRINRDRARIIDGIGRYSLKQIALAEQIDATRATMSDLMQADPPDYDRVDALEEKLDWDERIFRDRAQSLTYVCETPVLLEKRVYAIAQMLLRHAPE